MSIYFVNFKSFQLKHSNIFCKIIWWCLIANKNGQIGMTNWNYRSETNFSESAAGRCRKIFSEFSHICPNGGRCICEKTSWNTRSIKSWNTRSFLRAFFTRVISAAKIKPLDIFSGFSEFSILRYVTPCFSSKRLNS